MPVFEPTGTGQAVLSDGMEGSYNLGRVDERRNRKFHRICGGKPSGIVPVNHSVVIGICAEFV
jgi:hypothetical protein